MEKINNGIGINLGWEGHILDTNWGTVYYIVFLVSFALVCSFSAFTFAKDNPDTVHSIVQGDTSSHFDSFVVSHDYLEEISEYDSCTLC